MLCAILDLHRRVFWLLRKETLFMTLWEEVYFEITFSGEKSELRKIVNFLNSGELDDFFEVTPEYIIFDDTFNDATEEQSTEIVFTNDDYPIETDEFDTDEFLEVICKAGRKLEVYGMLSDAEGNEYKFSSPKGDSYYINSRESVTFNDELDEVAYKEEEDAE